MPERKSTTSIPRFPVITIPNDYQVNEYGQATFQLDTARGSIQVVSDRLGLKCIGNFETLAVYGLARAEWLPGIPGNNKIRQTVIFGDDGPYLVLGNQRSLKRPPSHIVIVRESAHRYAVIVPRTVDQNKLLNDIRRIENEKQMPHEYQNQTYKPESPGEVRKSILRMFDAAMSFLDSGMSLNDEKLAKNGLQFDQDSKHRINKVYGELRRAFTECQLVQVVSGLKRDGNVVYLGLPSKS